MFCFVGCFVWGMLCVVGWWCGCCCCWWVKFDFDVEGVWDFDFEGIFLFEGFCKLFDVVVDGYGWVEGVNVVFFKRFDDVVWDGNFVRVVIWGFGINVNGYSCDGFIFLDSVM